MRGRALGILAFLFLLVSAGVCELKVLGTFTTNTQPSAIAINPVTNTVYVANYGSNTVTIRAVGSPASSYSATGTNPSAIAVNPTTNIVYIANSGSGNVTMLNGATSATSTIQAGTGPVAIAVDTKRNRIYVANNGSNNITVIDGATNNISTVEVGLAPLAIAVNISNGEIYVANEGSASVTAINPASLSTTTIPAGTNPTAIAVNPFSNRIYVANAGSSNVTVIDGTTNTVSATVGTGSAPCTIAINPATNTIYVGNRTSGGLTLIAGATNAASTIAVGSGVAEVAVNPTGNRVYAMATSGNVYDVDGSTGLFTTLNLKTTLSAIAVNPLTNVVFAVEQNTKAVAQLDPGRQYSNLGSGPMVGWVLANPATGDVYYLENSYIEKINELSNTTTWIEVASNFPSNGVLNPMANEIYAVNSDKTLGVFLGDRSGFFPNVGSNILTFVLNPATNTIFAGTQSGILVIDVPSFSVTATIPLTYSVCSIAVNPATNLVYVGGCYPKGWNVGVFDAVTAKVTPVTGCPVGSLAQVGISVDTNRNEAYVNCGGNLLVEYGASTSLMPVALPWTVGAPTTNSNTGLTWFVPNDSTPLIVRNNATGATRGVNAPTNLLAVDAATNVAYSSWSYPANCFYGWVDGTMPSEAIPTGELKGLCVDSIAVNPITSKAYFQTNLGVNLAVGPFTATLPFAIAVTPVIDTETVSGYAMFATYENSPSFKAKVSTGFKPNTLGSGHLYYQMDTTVGNWQAATLTSAPGTNPATYSISLNNVRLGVHTLYAYAVAGDQMSHISGTPFAVLSTHGTGAMAAIVSPSPGKLGSASTKFTWTTGTNVSQYRLTIGTTQGANDVADVSTALTSATVTLPNNGEQLYLTLQSEIGGVWRGTNYTYTAPGIGTAATITSPSTSSTLPSSQTFSWTKGDGISQYNLYLGTTPGAKDIAFVNTGSTTRATVSNIPTIGETVYVYLWSQNGTSWLHEGYTYYASGTGTPAKLTSPANGAHLSSAIQTFTWSSPLGAAEVVLQIGTTAGAHDIDSINVTGMTSYQVTNLPTNGKTIYVTLATLNGKTWINEAYTFTAGGAVAEKR